MHAMQERLESSAFKRRSLILGCPRPRMPIRARLSSKTHCWAKGVQLKWIQGPPSCASLSLSNLERLCCCYSGVFHRGNPTNMSARTAAHVLQDRRNLYTYTGCSPCWAPHWWNNGSAGLLKSQRHSSSESSSELSSSMMRITTPIAVRARAAIFCPLMGSWKVKTASMRTPTYSKAV